MNGKSKVLAGLLGIIPPTGALGIHRFYLGYTGLGIFHIALFFVGVILSLTVILAFFGLPLIFGNIIWAIIEGVMILTGSIDKDGAGKPLVK